MLASGFRPWLKTMASLSSLVVDDGGNRTFSKIKPSKLDWDQLELRQWFQKILEVGEMGGVQQGNFPKGHPPSYQPRQEPMSRSMQVAY